MPDPSELFTNVFVKGLGTEVDLILHPSFFCFLLPSGIVCFDCILGIKL